MTHTTQPDLFSRQQGIALRDAGMKRASDRKPHLLELARNEAEKIARAKGTVTMDDVSEVLFTKYRIEPGKALGNASGAVFRGDPRFVFTGRYVKARRVKSRGRDLKVWKLK